MRLRFVILCVVALMVGLLPQGARANSPIPSDLVAQAQKGNAEAQFELGQIYRGGRGVQKSYKVAIEWYRKSAIQGYAPAEARLGGMYLGGYGGLPKDENEAREWLMKAANQGDTSAKLELAIEDTAFIKWERTLPSGAGNAMFFGSLALVLAAVVGLIAIALELSARAARLVMRR